MKARDELEKLFGDVIDTFLDEEPELEETTDAFAIIHMNDIYEDGLLREIYGGELAFMHDYTFPLAATLHRAHTFDLSMYISSLSLFGYDL